MNLTDQSMLKMLRDGPKLESQIVGSGFSRSLNRMLRDGFVDMGADPRVKDRDGALAAVVMLTEKGRAAVARREFAIMMAKDIAQIPIRVVRKD